MKDSLKQALTGVKKYIDNNVNDINTNKADKVEIPTKLSDLENDLELTGLQTKEDEGLNTEDKTIVGAINELEYEAIKLEEFVNTMLSGLRLVQMTQSEYDALEVKDSSTLYIII